MLEIHIINNKPYAWTALDAAKLREDYRIAGALVGCLAKCPNQNQQLGLPLQLMPEEAKLLADKGLAKIVRLIPRKGCTKGEVKNYEETQQKLYEEQAAHCEINKKEEQRRLAQVIIRGKKTKRNKLLQERRDKGEDIDDAEFEKEIHVDVENMKTPKIPFKHTLKQLPTVNPFVQPKLEDASDWSFPDTEKEKLRYKTYKNLWEKGHYLTNGGKFGGDFLVYPGDPSRFHSFYIAVCVPYDKILNPLDIVAMGRLGSNVKKTLLLCSVDDKGQFMELSLKWTGLS